MTLETYAKVQRNQLDMVKTVRDHMVFFDKYSQYSFYKRVKTGQMIRIARGIYLQKPLDQPLWEAIMWVNIARCFAVMHMNPNSVLTGVGAGLLHGYPLHGNRCISSLSLLVPAHLGRRPSELGRVEIGFKTHQNSKTITFATVPACKVRRLATDLGKVGFSSFGNSRGWFTDERFSVAQVARSEDPLVALIMLDAFMAIAARVDRDKPKQSNQVMAQVRGALLNSAPLQEPNPGVLQARELVRYCDGWLDSPLETWARWHFFRLGIYDFVPQYFLSMPTRDPRRAAPGYYVDFYFPKQKIIVEVDGYGKYGEGVELQQMALAREHLRQTALIEQGNHLIRWTKAELSKEVTIKRSLEAAFKRQNSELVQKEAPKFCRKAR